MSTTLQPPDRIGVFDPHAESGRPQLDLWLARTRGRRTDEVYRDDTAEVVEDEQGVRVLRMVAGTQRTWE
jgi:hypothetical protein